MRRRHWFEFTDQPWFPAEVRGIITDSLDFGAAKLGFYTPVVPILVRFLRTTGRCRVLDLGSGSGGPWLSLREPVSALHGRPVVVTLSDLRPPPAAVDRVQALHDACIRYLPQPLNALHVPEHLPGVRTLFTTFHHFTPDEARAILRGATRARVPIAVFEFTERNVLNVLVSFAVPLVMAVLTPFIRPRTLSRFVFTYVVPIAPLANLWDGVVSSLRSYTPEELLELGQSADENFLWEVGTVTNPRGPRITWLQGRPRTSSGGPPAVAAPVTATHGHAAVPSFDAVVIGAGLAGMTAALRLRRAGLSVALLDRSPVAGGLCGSFEHQGHRFTRGCNDFAGRFAEELAAVGVRVPFRPSTNLVYLDKHRITQPPDLTTAAFALRHAPDLARLVRSVRDSSRATMDEVLTRDVRSETASSLVATLAYPMGTPFYRLSRDALRRAFSPQWRYGYGRSVVPENGAQSITDAMLARLGELGVTPRLGVAVTEVSREGGGFIVRTTRGVVRARAVVRSADRATSAGAREGLSAVQFLFVLPRSLPWLREFRALIVLPERPGEWLSALDEGSFPATFGFHVFRDYDEGDEYTATGYCLAPRGVDTLDAHAADLLRATVVRRIDQEIPGFAGALRHAWVIDPATYRATHGLRPVLALGAGDRAVAFDEATGQYLIGNVGVAPGEHATSAVVSAAISAEEVIAALTPA